MNENVCKLCRRYGGRNLVVPEGMSVRWWCAKSIMLKPSLVVPGHSYYEKYGLHPVAESMKQPPDWCDRTLEQVLLEKDAKPDIRGDQAIVYDGNEEAERNARRVAEKGIRF